VSDLEDAGEPELNAAAIVEVLNRHQDSGCASGPG
jgi:hypothetical protein